ncbi:MAG TPA: hypothetical protein VKE70_06100 [Candidatus Solibacter sp.]|nr:hypothetical protein [Candidatus Solibacter sp.]
MFQKPDPSLTLALELLPEGVLVATVTGPVSLEGAVQRFQETFAFAAQNSARKILINTLHATGNLSLSERYRLATRVVQHYRSLKIGTHAVALVGKPPLVNGFGLQVARNMGALALLFADTESALRWLTSPQLNRS